MDKQVIQKFLKHFPNTWIQTFDDKGKDKSLTTDGALTKYTKDGGALLKSLNEKGAGIFFTPNGFKGSRKKTNCTQINAWFVEMDEGTIEEQYEKVLASPLEPSAVVWTGNKSLHVYWFALNGSVSKFTEIQKLLIAHFNGDPACKDCSRVLRLPTFYHNKKDPVMVELIEDFWKPENIYTEGQIIHYFGGTKIRTKDKDFWQQVYDINCRQALEKLSGTPIVNGETYTFRPRTGGGEFIDVNGEPADAWLDPQGRIGSGKGGGPSIIKWLEFYNTPLPQIAEWAKGSGLLKNGKVKASSRLRMKDYASKVVEKAKEDCPFTWGVDVVDGVFPPLKRGRYVVLSGETGAGKTAYSFHMAIENAKRGLGVCFLSLEMGNDNLLERYARNVLGISKHDFKAGRYDSEEFGEVVASLPSTLYAVELDDVANIDFLTKEIQDPDHDIVFVDNFGYIEDETNEKVNDKIAKVSRAMATLAHDTNTTIVALHHFRKPSSQSGKFRGLNELMGSAKISHDVDFAIQVWREQPTDDEPDERTSMQKAELAVVLQKDREWGELTAAKVYKNLGGFSAEHERHEDRIWNKQQNII
jgi:hypothetical protein